MVTELSPCNIYNFNSCRLNAPFIPRQSAKYVLNIFITFCVGVKDESDSKVSDCFNSMWPGNLSFKNKEIAQIGIIK